jgi:hypothetical protein
MVGNPKLRQKKDVNQEINVRNQEIKVKNQEIKVRKICRVFREKGIPLKKIIPE